MNIIVIVADSLRADCLGCYGSEVKTPHIDSFAEESTVLEQAFSENLPTMPTRAAWWTGRYLYPTRPWEPMHLDDRLLAEVLWNKGYASALITDVYHMHKPSYNCGRGFDTTEFIRGQEYDPWIVDENIAVDLSKMHRLRGDDSDAHWRRCFVQYMRNRTTFESEEDHFAPRVAKRAMRWLDDITQYQKDNLLMWVDFFDPHEPWDPPSPYREMYDPDYDGQELIDPVPGPVEGYITPEELNHTFALYKGKITFIDKWIGKLLDRIRELGLFDNSIVMFTSDHGEPFGEHGVVRKSRLEGHEELAHIPWVVRHPEVGHGERSEALVQTPDLMPTVLDAAGVEAKQTFTGTSLMPILEGQKESVRDFAVTSSLQKSRTIRTPEWTYIMYLDGDSPELYDRKNDPTEQRNVLAEHKGIADALELQLRRFTDKVLTAPQE
jgi:arylsulfatase A-like enzyme